MYLSGVVRGCFRYEAALLAGKQSVGGSDQFFECMFLLRCKHEMGLDTGAPKHTHTHRFAHTHTPLAAATTTPTTTSAAAAIASAVVVACLVQRKLILNTID